MRIRHATAADIPRLVEGNQRLAAETEQVTLDRAILSAGVSALFEYPTRGLYWVAEHDGKVMGQLMITFEWSDWRNANLWWLQSVYVWPEARRQGIFSTLLDAVTATAQAHQVPELRLYAETHNQLAHSAYARHGFCTGHYGVHTKVLASP